MPATALDRIFEQLDEVTPPDDLSVGGRDGVCQAVDAGLVQGFRERPRMKSYVRATPGLNLALAPQLDMAERLDGLEDLHQFIVEPLMHELAEIRADVNALLLQQQRVTTLNE